MDRIPFLEKELFLLRRIVTPGDVCVDIGAAGAVHTAVMARRAGPAGRVLAFEPRPGSARMLGRLVRMLRIADRVEVFPVALAAGDGVEPLRIPVVPTRAHLLGSSALADRAAAFAALPYREIEVPTVTLDRVVHEAGLSRVDVLKCDVEGAELGVLAGARWVLGQLRPMVVIEADDLHQRRYDATAQDVVDAVVAHGYRPFRYRRAALDQVVSVTASEDDYVLVPAERPVPLAVRYAGSPAVAR